MQSIETELCSNYIPVILRWLADLESACRSTDFRILQNCKSFHRYSSASYSLLYSTVLNGLRTGSIQHTVRQITLRAEGTYYTCVHTRTRDTTHDTHALRCSKVFLRILLSSPFLYASSHYSFSKLHLSQLLCVTWIDCSQCLVSRRYAMRTQHEVTAKKTEVMCIQ